VQDPIRCEREAEKSAGIELLVGEGMAGNGEYIAVL
jgi:hypothetical protein